VEILKKLVSRGGVVGLTELHMNRSAIHFGARNGSIPILKTLIEAVANNDERLQLVNAPDKSGFTPVFIAKTNGHQEAFEFLLMKGAQYNEASQPVPNKEAGEAEGEVEGAASEDAAARSTAGGGRQARGGGVQTSPPQTNIESRVRAIPNTGARETFPSPGKN
jgi:ankyrin repeat protein